MPTYSYSCDKCEQDFELFYHIDSYDPQPACPSCGKNKTHRLYVKDVLTQSASVKKSDTELKTIGDLALRNSEKMSDDQKHDLYFKHNSYKLEEGQKELPAGMKRVKKPLRPKWPGSQSKIKRKPNK